MATITKTLYDTDFALWSAQTAELLREGRFDEVDAEHVAEEIEDLGNSNFKAARSQLRRMLMHLVKHSIQQERDGSSRRGSIVNASEEILYELRCSPSLRRRLADEIEDVYREAIRVALAETGLADQRDDLRIPDCCPFTLADLLGDRPDLLKL